MTSLALKNPSELKRAVIYLRVSTEAQTKRAGTDEGYSIEAQRDACTLKAESLGAIVVDEFVDAGESAKSTDRPALQAMLERVEREHDVDLVIVHKLDRLSRNRLDDAMISVRIEAAKARLVSVVEHIDETPSGVLMHALLAAFNEYQIRNHATEVMKGSVKKAQGGGTPFLAPIGYLNKRDLRDGKDLRWIEPDPDRAPLIRWAFEAYATGEYPLRVLLNDLTAKGLTNRPTAKRPGRPIHLSKLAEILRNRYYIGKVVYRGIEYDGKHEPLIDQELFDRVQHVFKLHDLAGERIKKHRHYLKGSLFCARCGERLGFSFFKGHGGVYPYFFCYGRQRGNGCDLPFLAADDVDDWVIDHHSIIELDPGLIGEVRNKLRAELEQGRKQGQRLLKRESAKLSRLSHERTKLMHAYYQKLIPDELLLEEQERISRGIEEANQALAFRAVEFQEIEAAVTEALEIASDCQRAYKEAPADVRRLFNHTFFKKIFVDTDRIAGADLTDEVALIMGDEIAARFERELPQALLSGVGLSKTCLVEVRGFEPLTSAVRRQRSTPELHPLFGQASVSAAASASREKTLPFGDEGPRL